MPTFFIAPASHATTPGNDTTGTGTSLLPWLTISKAHTSAATGDTIICKNGTYTWSSQTFTKSLIIQAENSGLAIFDGAAASFAWTFGSITISTIGIIFQNASRTSASGYIFTSGSASAVVLFSRCSFLTLSIDGGAFALGGIFGVSQNAVSCQWSFVSCLLNNPIKNNTSHQQIFSTVDPSGDDVVSLSIESCVVYLSTTGGLAMNSIIAANYAGRVLLRLVNNIIFNGTGNSLSMTTTGNSGSFSTTANYNDFHNITSPPSGTGNITTDPLFENPAGGNFNLRPTSSSQNVGTLV